MMRALQLIGLCGRAGAGKTTVGNYLEHEWAFEHMAFADPIVNMIGALFDDAGVPAPFIDDRTLKETPTSIGFSYRHLAQTLGTEWGRSLAPDFWLRIAQAKLRIARQHGAHVVISDVRFANEAAWIQHHGGLLVRVLRDEGDGERREVRAHASEQEWAALGVDHELLNHGSVTTLKDQVDRLVGNLLGTP